MTTDANATQSPATPVTAGQARDGGPERDARVDEVLAGPVERRVEEGTELRGLAGRSGERAVEEVEDAEREHEDARDEPQLGAAAAPPRWRSR